MGYSDFMSKAMISFFDGNLTDVIFIMRDIFHHGIDQELFRAEKFEEKGGLLQELFGDTLLACLGPDWKNCQNLGPIINSTFLE